MIPNDSEGKICVCAADLLLRSYKPRDVTYCNIQKFVSGEVMFEKSVSERCIVFHVFLAMS